jgi:NAD(P)-dependent dehydrogenase (short-subunit alcohol dehydrogenase family)
MRASEGVPVSRRLRSGPVSTILIADLRARAAPACFNAGLTSLEKTAMSQTVLVTGANRGLGLEFVRQIVDRGDTVIATCRDPQSAPELAATGAQVETVDVGETEDLRALASRLEGRAIDLLINNAGMGVGGRAFHEEDFDGLARFFEVNAIAPMRLSQLLLDNLRAGRGKTIVNVTSKMGSIDDNTSGGAYGYRGSKAALNMLTKSMALDLRREGIQAIVIHPGWVATDMGGSAAPLSTPDSVKGMLAVVDGLGPEQSGHFFDYSGAELPW